MIGAFVGGVAVGVFVSLLALFAAACIDTDAIDPGCDDDDDQPAVDVLPQLEIDKRFSAMVHPSARRWIA